MADCDCPACELDRKLAEISDFAAVASIIDGWDAGAPLTREEAGAALVRLQKRLSMPGATPRELVAALHESTTRH